MHSIHNKGCRYRIHKLIITHLYMLIASMHSINNKGCKCRIHKLIITHIYMFIVSIYCRRFYFQGFQSLWFHPWIDTWLVLYYSWSWQLDTSLPGMPHPEDISCSNVTIVSWHSICYHGGARLVTPCTVQSPLGIDVVSFCPSCHTQTQLFWPRPRRYWHVRGEKDERIHSVCVRLYAGQSVRMKNMYT
jgi:hypothetical protein